MHPKEIIQHWVKIFNSGNAQALATLYHDGAINHQVNQEPTVGKIAIQEKFENSRVARPFGPQRLRFFSYS